MSGVVPGNYEVYVRPFSRPEASRKISTGGGSAPYLIAEWAHFFLLLQSDASW
jgi:hypothetical protein